MAELICSDMVAIEERPKYLGIFLAVSAPGTGHRTSTWRCHYHTEPGD
jgi:hypothetical protein